MIGGHINGGHVEKQSLGQAAILLGNARESLQFLRVYNRQVESGFRAVVEEDRIDDLTGSGGETEGDVRDAEDHFDILDLLLDETD